MLRGLFVTGTDTNVGKTVASAAIMHRYRQALPLRYWKPIQTGIEQNDDTATVRMLGACHDAELFTGGIRLPRPVSPHLAAELEHTRIDPAELRARVTNEPQARGWVVEGAGGVLAPINESELMIDLMVCLALPVVVIARSTLGTINHTLLTLEALRTRALHVGGVVMVGERNRDNRNALEKYGRVAVLGEMPHFPALTPEILREWTASNLDPEGQLASFFQ